MMTALKFSSNKNLKFLRVGKEKKIFFGLGLYTLIIVCFTILILKNCVFASKLEITWYFQNVFCLLNAFKIIGEKSFKLLIKTKFHLSLTSFIFALF